MSAMSDWLDALKSGNYKQTTGFLCGRTRDGEQLYCATGLLLMTLGYKVADNGQCFLNSGGGFLARRAFPWEVLKKTDIDSEDVAVAQHLNDCDELSFAEIAERLEK